MKSKTQSGRRFLFGGIPLVLICFGVVGAVSASVMLTRLQEYHVSPRHKNDHGVRVDPWRPLPGCITLRSNEGQPLVWLPDKATEAVCSGRFEKKLPVTLLGNEADDARFGSLLRAVSVWRVPLRPSAEHLTQQFSSSSGQSLPQGADVEITIKPDLQDKASRLLECMTGKVDRCDDFGIDRKAWGHHYEDAAMRSGAILIVDVASGEIEVAAAAQSDCYTGEQKGETLTSKCPPGMNHPNGKKWMLENAALFSNEMPGSFAKIPMMLGFLRDQKIGPKIRRPGAEQERFINDVRHSDTANFLDRAFCRDQRYECQRLPLIAQAARDLGWNTDRINLVANEHAYPQASLSVYSGRMLQKLDAKETRWQDYGFKYLPEAARICAEQKPDSLRWSKCRNESVANLAAELWGQGNSRISPVGVADMLTRIAAAANGQQEIALPHLVREISGQRHGQQEKFKLQSRVNIEAIRREDAGMMLRAMGQTHQQGGTAYSACLQAMDKDAQAMARCNALKGVSGKTGTPVFNHDRLTVTQRAAHCAAVYKEYQEKGKAAGSALRAEFTQCQMRPIKWYAAVIRDNPESETGPWRKVVIALSERNWRLDGRIDSAFDRGTPNIAAEMVFRLIAQGVKNG